MFCPNIHSRWSESKNSLTNMGHFFELAVLRTNNDMLSSNWMFCPITPLWVVRCDKFLPSQMGVVFPRWSFWVPKTLCYLQNLMFCPITPFQVVRMEKFLLKQGSFFPDDCGSGSGPIYDSPEAHCSGDQLWIQVQL